MLIAMRCWQMTYGQSGFLNSPAEGPVPLQFALIPPRTSCILHSCTVIPSVVITSKRNAFRFDSKPPLQCPTHLLIRLQVLLFPLQACGSGPGDKANLAFPVLYFPMLSGVVEFDIGGPMDFKPAEFMQRESFGPEALSGSVGVE